MKKKKLRPAAFLTLLCITLSACRTAPPPVYEEKAPGLTITSPLSAQIESGGTYRLSYDVTNAPGGVGVAVTREDGGGDGVYDSATATFTAVETGVYTLTVTALNITKTTTATVTVTVTPIPPQIVSKEELMTTLSNGPYKNNIATDGFIGLSDAASVGVDKDKFLNEVRYPVPADTAFAQIYDVTAHGILPSNADNSPALANLMTAVRNVAGLKKIYFPSGVYRFASALTLNGHSDIYFAGQNAEWLMTNWTNIWSVTDCRNIHVNGINFDFAVSPTIAGVVKSSNAAARTVTITVNDEFDMTDYRYDGGKVEMGNYMEYVYDPATERDIPDRDGMLRYNSTGDKRCMLADGVYNQQNNELTITFAGQSLAGDFIAPAVGKKVSVGYTMYEHLGFIVEECENFYMESCNIYTVPGMMFMGYSSKNLYFNRANIALRPGSTRLQTATADGLHTIDCYGDLIVSNGLYENSHDDAMNFCTFYFRIDSSSGKRLTCTATSVEAPLKINAGDTVEIYDKDSLKLLDTRTVTESEAIASQFDLTLDKKVKVPQSVAVTDCLLINASRIPRMILENCVIRNKRNRGILAQVQNSEIKNCAFQNILHGGISIVSAKDIFSEGTVPRDIRVSGCKFIGNVEKDIAVWRIGGTIVPDCIRNIEVVNNFFYGSRAQGVYYRAAGGGSIRNNLFYNGLFQNSIYISKSSGVAVYDNYAYRESPLDGYGLFGKDGDSTDIDERGNAAEVAG
ncbi:MAG: right-handed parallel beta-helix repeat-containing protein [Clostridiales bacterium]|jgi:hypothetical protein|nr:right-handed parallel beta-helix repeat-containing protein [Clostridiales bacterium]